MKMKKKMENNLPLVSVHVREDDRKLVADESEHNLLYLRLSSARNIT